MTRRIERLNEIIKVELGKIILKEIDFPEGVLVTITRVDTSPELSQAKVYISIFPDNLSQKALNILFSQIYFLQKAINYKLQMRPVPRLVLCQEKETISAGRVDELLEKVKTETVVKKRKK
ncbi:MAG: ribosome-binding factor A [bacterium]|nr:ribosome-binding factor A [bacterium]